MPPIDFANVNVIVSMVYKLLEVNLDIWHALHLSRFLGWLHFGTCLI